MDFDIKRVNFENLVEVPVLSLIDYVGIPILVSTPDITYAYNGKNKVAMFESGSIYKWIIFDGTIKLTPDTKNVRYFTFKEIKTK